MYVVHMLRAIYMITFIVIHFFCLVTAKGSKLFFQNGFYLKQIRFKYPDLDNITTAKKFCPNALNLLTVFLYYCVPLMNAVCMSVVLVF